MTERELDKELKKIKREILSAKKSIAHISNPNAAEVLTSMVSVLERMDKILSSCISHDEEYGPTEEDAFSIY